MARARSMQFKNHTVITEHSLLYLVRQNNYYDFWRIEAMAFGKNFKNMIYECSNVTMGTVSLNFVRQYNYHDFWRNVAIYGTKSFRYYFPKVIRSMINGVPTYPCYQWVRTVSNRGWWSANMFDCVSAPCRKRAILSEILAALVSYDLLSVKKWKLHWTRRGSKI
jgi:hypothetical protein